MDEIRIGTKIVDGIIFRKRNIISVEFGITYKCNLCCAYCLYNFSSIFMEGENNQARKEMTSQEIKKVFSLLNGLNVERVNLSGGEPLVRDNIIEILEGVFSNKFKVSLTTNGILVPEYIDLLMKLDPLIISIDGTKETHDSLRGEGTHECALKAIDLSKKKRIKVFFSTVVTQKTTEEDLSFLLKLSAFYDTFCIFQPVWYGGFYKNGYVRYNNFAQPVSIPEELDPGQLKNLYKYLKKNPDKKRVFGGDYFFRFILDFNKRRQAGLAALENCVAGKFFLYIAPNGSVFTCSGGFQKLFKNKIYEYSLAEIRKAKINQIKCTGCCCYTYKMLNNLAKFDFGSIVCALRYRCI